MKKHLLFLVTLFFCLFARADLGGGGSAGGTGTQVSLRELVKIKNKYHVEIPRIEIDGIKYPITGLCQTSTSLKTITPDTLPHPDLQSFDIMAEIPLLYMQRKCSQIIAGKCFGYEEKDQRIPTVFEIPVIRRLDNYVEMSAQEPLFYVTYEISTCGRLE